MAKVAFTKLGLTKNTDIKTIEWKDQIIEIKQYLPIQEKMELIVSVLNQIQDDNNFINETKLSLYFDLEIIYHYTNISFTEKQKEDSGKLYDLCEGSGLTAAVVKAIPETELMALQDQLRATANHIYEYRNSIYGILDAMNTDYKNLDLDAKAIRDQISDPEALGTLKQVLTKLG